MLKLLKLWFYRVGVVLNQSSIILNRSLYIQMRRDSVRTELKHV